MNLQQVLKLRDGNHSEDQTRDLIELRSQLQVQAGIFGVSVYLVYLDHPSPSKPLPHNPCWNLICKSMLEWCTPHFDGPHGPMESLGKAQSKWPTMAGEESESLQRSLEEKSAAQAWIWRKTAMAKVGSPCLDHYYCQYFWIITIIIINNES